MVSDGSVPQRPENSETAALCRSLLPRLRLYARRRLPDVDAAEDLAQEVLVVVLEAVATDRVREPRHVRRFALGVARNMINDGFRTDERRRRLVQSRLPPTANPRIIPELFDMYKVLSCMGRLTQKARTLMLMTFAEDRDTAEIAEALEMTPGSVRVARHRAIDLVRRCVEGGAT